jgi:hypothetical protein
MRDETRKVGRWVAIAAGVLLLVAAAARMTRETPSPPAASPGGEPGSAVTRQDLERLRADLEFERLARRALAEEVALLRRTLEASGGLARAGVHARPAEEPREESEAEIPQPVAEAGDKLNSAGFDTPALVTAGLAEQDAARLRERWEAHQLEKLELSNVALREGWKGRRLRQEMYALEGALRSELGDEWDAYLYATGEENRLRVNEILADSAASAAGFEKGDLIVSYDRERIYDPGGLRRNSAACSSGSYVTVEVIRDGNPETLRVRCGPLGTLIDHVKRPPLTP